MEKKLSDIGKKYETMKAAAQKYGGLVNLLWESARSFFNEAINELGKELEKLYEKSPEKLMAPEEFWHPELEKAIIQLTDHEFLNAMKVFVEMRLKGPFSRKIGIKSYHSTNFGYHVWWIIRELAGCLKMEADGIAAEDIVAGKYEWNNIHAVWVALEICRGNIKVINGIKEAIAGDNQEYRLSYFMVRAVIISENEELLELLLQLLLGAKLQEGVRQMILENADEGSANTLVRILKVCIDEDLFRFSSTVRAFGIWTGLGYEFTDKELVKKASVIAYECLTDERKRSAYEKSESNLETYMALWASGCYEIDDMKGKLHGFLDAEKKYHRILGWMFVSQMNQEVYQMNLAAAYLQERDDEVLAWIIKNLTGTGELYRKIYSDQEEMYLPVRNAALPEDREERKKLFYRLKTVSEYIGNRKHVFNSNPFKFITVELSNEMVMDCILSVVAYDRDLTLINELADLVEYMGILHKKIFYKVFLQPEKYEKHLKYLMDALADRSPQIKEMAGDMLSKYDLDENKLRILAGNLRSKNAKVRKAVVKTFRNQKKENLLPIIREMLCSKEEYHVQAALELLTAFQEEQSPFIDLLIEEVKEIEKKKLSAQTKILLEQFRAKQKNQEDFFSEENGFGLYDPEKACRLNLLTFNIKNENETIRNVQNEEDLKKLYPSREEFEAVLDKMNAVFEKHADYEYEVENWFEERTTILFGSTYQYIWIPAKYGQVKKNQRKLYMIPFHEEFMDALGEYAENPLKMIGLYLVSSGYIGKNAEKKPEAENWFKEIEEKEIDRTFYKRGIEKYGNRYLQMTDIFDLMYENLNIHEVFETAFSICQMIVQIIGKENLASKMYKETKFTHYDYSGAYNHAMYFKPLSLLRHLLKCTAESAEDFSRRFQFEFQMEEIVSPRGYYTYHLSMEECFKACDMGSLSKDGLYKYLMVDWRAQEAIMYLTNPIRYVEGKNVLEKYTWASKVVNQAVRRIIETEVKRGELETPVTAAAAYIQKFEGAKYFCSLLAALGKDKFYRGYSYMESTTKQNVLSRLLKRCYPAKEDTPEVLSGLLKQNNIDEKRLVEAVMYAPQWSGFVEKILEWPGLKSAVWFFHAHINETFSAEKETEVALYSSITPEEFNDGVFDRNWFFQSYEQLGEERFQILYKAAKYITSGNNLHRRSQMYTDAALGRFDKQNLETEIREKRNQEKLRCYSLLPLDPAYPDDAFRRYEFIQNFMNESKQFGAQRRENETLAGITALENLAITTGFMDVNRMIWYLESERFERIRPLMEQKEIGTVKVWMEIDSEGIPELVVEKNGKRQKTVSGSLGKNEWILKLKDTIRQLKVQHRRAKMSLERAMNESTEFELEELKRICGNPVLAPIISKLVWTDGKRIGFIEKKERIYLYGLSVREEILPDQRLRVAHPHDLKNIGCWSEYMHYLYDKQIQQPFKQIFREYYPLTKEERNERTISRRYEGHQVQPGKAATLLKGRGWTVDYENGLQKVYHKENLIVRMFAMADWFSPSDIEAPTIEEVQFFDRKTERIVELSKIPPIIFSEVMRDIDLVVSVAHAGGMDPEASHSTVEMRIAIAKELLKLLKFTNVEFIANHAKIKGNLSNYSIHMGSGVVHAEGSGMIAVLPVHSQARGRIFLPFADDDPKTAEVLSKIILFADDRKIKDVSILEQI